VSLRLPVDLYSADQLSAVIIELRNYISTLHDVTVRAKAGKNDDEALHASALLLGVFHGAEVNSDDLAACEKLLKDLEAVRSKAPTAHLTLPALPNRTLKRQLTVWFRTQINPYTLLTFAMRGDIGGGIIVQTGSRVYDFSLREQLFGNRQRISEIFDRV
jgi:hypothetical protein